MANYIKFKAADINHANQLSDIILANVESVFQGVANGNGDANKFVVIAGGGRTYTFTVDFYGKEWANAVIFAATANPGGPLAIVQKPAGASKITDFVVSN